MIFKLAKPESADFLEFNAELSDFQSKKVIYHKPEVWRLWLQVGEYRVNLHKIFKSEETELYHPHPWAMSTTILKGQCEVGFGFGKTNPEICALSVYQPKSTYKMLHPQLWHYVKPLSDSILTIMVSGKPWENQTSFDIRPTQVQPELNETEKHILWNEICDCLLN